MRQTTLVRTIEKLYRDVRYWKGQTKKYQEKLSQQESICKWYRTQLEKLDD